MLVRAKKVGYYNHERHYPEGSGHARSGLPFRLIPVRTKKDGKEIVISPEQQFSERWMERVSESEPAREAAIPVAEALTIVRRGPGRPPKTAII